MDSNLKKNVINRLEAAAKALRKNQFEAYVVESPEDLIKKLKELLPQNASICSGGSMTLEETGVNKLLSGGDYDFYYRGRTNEKNGEPIDVFLKAFSCDWYFCSSNAITLSGELYNVDGNSNRVAAISYGPKNVVVIAGSNKIVKNLTEADERVRSTAAPASCLRLGIENGCHLTGHCIDCRSKSRICCTTTIHSFQRDPNRIKVFLLADEFGY